MVPRRMPAGSLAGLAVVLAALAVVVVAGARTEILRVVSPQHASSSATTRPSAPQRGGHGRGTPPADEVATSGHGSSPGSSPTSTSLAPTTTAPSTTSTTTSTSTTTTTTPSADALPTRASGWFVSGSNEVRRAIGSVRFVSVSVSAGVDVTLTVRCGILHQSSTSVSATTVVLPRSPASCIATISVPPSTLQPASWRLVAR